MGASFSSQEDKIEKRIRPPRDKTRLFEIKERVLSRIEFPITGELHE